ncbi:MAG: BamA/TamA family outer membrane protein [Rhodothermales bacterium]|nr:BamA/TamA family outer membrane protein [Rhodothermales bacterium]
MKRTFTAIALIAAIFVQQPANAQERVASTVPPEYESVVYTVQRVVGLLQDVTQRHASDPISNQILSISDRLSMSGPVTGGFRSNSSDEDLVAILKDVERELRSISRSLERRGEDNLAERLDEVLDDLEKAIDEAGSDTRIRRSSKDRYEIRKGSSKVKIISKDDDWWDEDNEWEKEDRKAHRFPNTDRWHSDASTYVGEFTHRWPFREQGIYRNIPAFRYNRVEGFFLGFARAPLDWSSYDRGRVFGQVGYALGLEDWRWEAGAETRLGRAYHNDDLDLKLGGSYHVNTNTNDLWKSSWAENTTAAALFKHDFFDYYQTEGWTAYAVARITPFAQLSAGFRADTYSSLSKEVNWSLFGGDDFRPNPGIVAGDMKSFIFSLEGGQVRSFNSHPSGMAFRLEAEIGQGLDGDFDFSRYLGDLRGYARLTRDAGLNLRLRGGFTEGTVPVQKAFTLGGTGSVRGYPQNIFLGSRMILANAELMLFDPDIFDFILDDVAVFGLFDAGWTNMSGQNEFSTDDMVSSAGFGVAFDDRTFRLEVAWPLKNMGTGMNPSLWLRIAPSF